MPIGFQGMEGTIEFVDDAYITMCFNAYPTKDPHASKKVHKCCLLIFPHQWDEIELDPSVFQHKKAYRGKTNDHPGNEMLPPTDQR